MQSKTERSSFVTRTGLWQGCVLSPILVTRILDEAIITDKVEEEQLRWYGDLSRMSDWFPKDVNKVRPIRGEVEENQTMSRTGTRSREEKRNRLEQVSGPVTEISGNIYVESNLQLKFDTERYKMRRIK